jgi:hypothetical protein
MQSSIASANRCNVDFSSEMSLTSPLNTIINVSDDMLFLPDHVLRRFGLLVVGEISMVRAGRLA